MSKVVIVCPVCGSDDVTVDATARWSISEQDWSLSGTFDDRTCGSCGYESHSFDEKEIKDDENKDGSGERSDTGRLPSEDDSQ